MAFATKYRFNIYGHSVGTYFKVDLQTDGYAGSILNQDLGESSFHIKPEGEGGGKFGTSGGSCIKGTSASLSILIENQTDFDNFIEFATIGEQDWKMLIYKGTAPGNETIFHEMYVQPDVYQYPYEDFPYFINITATDEIGRLSSIKFYSSGTTRYTQRNTIMYFIFEILNKLGIQRSIREVCNIYSSEMGSAAGDSPLMQATADPTNYLINKGRDNEDVMDCHTVLNELLKPFCLVLTLGNDNKWYLRRPVELASSSHVQRIITDATTVASNSTISSHQISTNSVTSTGIKTFINSPTVQVDWRWKRMVLKFLLGDSGSLIIDGDFSPSAWSDINTLNSWTKVFRFDNGYSLTYERIELSETVECQEGHYFTDVEASSIFSFTVNTSTNQIIVLDAKDDQPSPLRSGDRVYLSATAGASMPSPLFLNQAYYTKDLVENAADGDSDDDTHSMQLSGSQGGSTIIITDNGTGTFYIGKAKEVTLSYAVQLNGYQTNLWSDDTIDNKAGIESATAGVVAGANNTFEISFWWKILFDNILSTQTNAAEAYYQLKLVGTSSTYYYNKTAGTWGTSVVVNTLSDTRLKYGWVKQTVQPADFPVDGDLSLILFTPSSTSNTDTLGVQYSLVESEFLVSGDDSVEYIQKVAEVGENYAYEPDEIEVMLGDAPSSSYKGHVGYGAGLTSDWSRRGVTESKELLDLMLTAYMNNYGRTTLKINGTFMGDYDSEQIISDSNQAYDVEGVTVTPKFMLSGGSYSVEDGTWSGEWIEINE